MTDMVPITGGRPLLQVNNLTVDFALRNGVFRAVDDLSFSIDPGKTLCVVGESGSGKSVTAALDPADRRRARPHRRRLDPPERPRRHVRSTSPSLRPARAGRSAAVRGRDIAMIFQEPMSSLSPVHTRRRPDRRSRSAFTPE